MNCPSRTVWHWQEQASEIERTRRGGNMSSQGRSSHRRSLSASKVTCRDTMMCGQFVRLRQRATRSLPNRSSTEPDVLCAGQLARPRPAWRDWGAAAWPVTCGSSIQYSTSPHAGHGGVPAILLLGLTMRHHTDWPEPPLSRSSGGAESHGVGIVCAAEYQPNISPS